MYTLSLQDQIPPQLPLQLQLQLQLQLLQLQLQPLQLQQHQEAVALTRLAGWRLGTHVTSCRLRRWAGSEDRRLDRVHAQINTR